MVHDPVEQGQIQFISQFIQFQLNTVGGTEILILSLYLAVQLDLPATGMEVICSFHSTMCEEDSLLVPYVNSEVISKRSYSWHVQFMMC